MCVSRVLESEYDSDDDHQSYLPLLDRRVTVKFATIVTHSIPKKTVGGISVDVLFTLWVSPSDKAQAARAPILITRKHFTPQTD